MAEREVIIKVSAKNLTEAEFKKVRSGLKGIGSSASGAKQKTTGLQRAFSSFGKAAPGAMKAVTIGAAAAGAAIVGIATGIMKLGERGAVVDDVKQAFDRLSMAAGETGAVMLSELQRGVKGTVTNFNLMRLANTALGAGLLESSGDARTLAEGARLLAKRTGGDTAQAFNTLTTAMASGRTAQLKQLGLFVDNKKAVEDYAAAQGTTVSKLTDADRATALQIATLAALRQELANNAPPLADFGELIEQGKVAVKNLVDSVAVMISKSPPLIAGMHAIRDVISKAFGGDQQGLVLGIVNIIEKAAIVVLEFAKSGISAAQFLYEGFAGIKVLILGIGIAFSDLSGTVLSFVARTLEAAASVPILGEAFGIQATAARAAATAVTGVNTAMRAEMIDAQAAALGNDTFSQSLNTAKLAVETVQTAVVNAGLSQRELNTATAEGTTGIGTFATANEEAAIRIKEACVAWGEKFRQELTDTGAQTKIWAEEEKIFLQELAGEQGLGGLGVALVGVGDIASIKTAEMTAAFRSFGIQTKTEMGNTVKKLEEDFEKIKKSGEATATDLEVAAKKLAEAQQKYSGETEKFTMTSNEAILTGTKSMLASLGTKNKAAAYASAVIGTAEAVVQALRSAPPPGSWVLAAINAAMGAVQIATIARSKPYRMGTPSLDYQQFGTQTTALLHGKEAVIPQGGGHRLAEEISGALARRAGAPRDTDIIAERFVEKIGSKLDTLPRAIQRAVRDGMLLSAT